MNSGSATTAATTRKATGWSILWGVLMLICGILAIAMPLASSIGLVILLGWLILFSALWHLIYAFQAGHAGAVLWQILLALLYGFVAIYMLIHPLLGVLSLTLVLGIFLVIEGVFEIILYFNIRTTSNAGWVLLDGIITLILGGLIWFHWPSSSVWVIGTLVGISLIFSGISRIMLCSAMRRLTPVTP
ncbi:MAG: HdeD family acid-resistance protein [Verrucomicrobia bacterium]|nr:HdeD family acid-resistance protein [Verrucomicrobiota bacterium]